MRGQIALYLIIAMVGIFALLFVMTSQFGDNLGTGASKVPQVKDIAALDVFTQTCVEKVSEDALLHFGLVGGEYFQKFFFYDQNYKIPYYVFEGDALIPSIDELEMDILANFVNTNLKKCTNGFVNVKGMSVTEGDVTTAVHIGEEAVNFDVTYPLDVTRGDEKASFERFTVNKPIRLSQMFSIANDIVSFTVFDEHTIYWDYMTDVTRFGYNITAHAEEGNTIIYRLVDSRSFVHKEPYIFQFATKVRTEWPGN